MTRARTSRKGNVNIDPRQFRSRVARSPRPKGGGKPQARVKAVGDNTLTCRFLSGNKTDGRTEADFNITVARPSNHRREEYDGTTTSDGWLYTYVSAIERTATKSGEAAETHRIAEPYEVDVTIIELDRIRGPGGVTKSGADIIVWMDSNSGGRAWGIV